MGINFAAGYLGLVMFNGRKGQPRIDKAPVNSCGGVPKRASIPYVRKVTLEVALGVNGYNHGGWDKIHGKTYNWNCTPQVSIKTQANCP